VLCVITGNDEAIRPWASAVRPTVLGDGAAWDDSALDIDPVVVQAMQSLTRTINHDNTISAGFEKDNVVSTLLALHGAGIRLNGEAMQGGALAHGWSGRNPSVWPAMYRTSTRGSALGAAACSVRTISITCGAELWATTSEV
jgi:hypothetical protein